MCNSNEPIYDDDQLALIEDQQTEQLVGDLVERIITLCNTAAELRMEINNLVQQLDPSAPPIYYEPYSDLCQSFEDHPTYSRFAEQLSRLIHE